MTGHNYPDNLYADALDNIRAVTQKPTGAYQAPAELTPAERKLRTALAYVNHARDLIRDALGDNDAGAQREAKIAYDVACHSKTDAEYLAERYAKWDVRWGKATSPDPAKHPMNAEAIRDHDERLSGAEDRL